MENNSHALISPSNRRQISICNHSKFAVLLATPKLQTTREIPHSIKPEMTSPGFSNGTGEHIAIKREKLDEETDDDDDSLLSRLIDYLIE